MWDKTQLSRKGTGNVSTDTMKQLAGWDRGNLVATVAQDAPREMIAAAIVGCLATGVTYEQMADDTGWSTEELQDVKNAYPNLRSAVTYAPAK